MSLGQEVIIWNGYVVVGEYIPGCLLRVSVRGKLWKVGDNPPTPDCSMVRPLGQEVI